MCIQKYVWMSTCAYKLIDSLRTLLTDLSKAFDCVQYVYSYSH